MAQLRTKANPAGVSATPSVGDHTSTPASLGFDERHYEVKELAKLWNLSDDTIRRLFRREPGVLVISNQDARHKHRYSTLRIPESVAQRMHRRLSLPNL